MSRIYSVITLLFILGLFFTGCADSGRVTAVPTTKTLPEIISLRVDPVSIRAGNSAQLNWGVQEADTVTIDQGIGSVAAAGSLTVAPVYTTTYKITVTNGAGIRERYITLAVDAPDTSGEIVGVDSVTGRNKHIELTWQDYCYSSQYQVQIARDADFTLVVFDSGTMSPAESTNPAFLYPSGLLEAGKTFFWRVRVRQAATGQRVLSPWSDVKPLTVSAGLPLRSDYRGIQALSPINGCHGCPVKGGPFSWTGYPGTTKYRFLLTKDSQLQNILVDALTATTAYELAGALEYGTAYFWQVMAVEPVPSDKSPTFTFITEDAPQSIKPVPASAEPPLWVWVVITVAAALISLVVFYIIKAGQK